MTTRALEDSEIKAIFDCVDGCNATRNRAMLIYGIGMALRASELVGLNVGDVIDLGGNVKTYVTIRGETAKFGKAREIRLWDIVEKELAKFIQWKKEQGQSIEPNAPLFLSREGGHLTTKALYYLTKKIFAKAAVDQSPHALRKTGGTIFYEESNYDLIATQFFLGHADPSTTKKYIGVPSKKTIETCRRSSNRLSRLIGGDEFTTNLQMVNSPFDDFSTSDLIVELKMRGFDISDIIQQLKAQRHKKEAKVIKFPAIA